MQNVECKCEVQDAELARLMLIGVGARHVGALTQVDTFYRIPDGRLLRLTPAGIEERAEPITAGTLSEDGQLHALDATGR